MKHDLYLVTFASRSKHPSAKHYTPFLNSPIKFSAPKSDGPDWEIWLVGIIFLILAYVSRR